jgi:hypothetical protein
LINGGGREADPAAFLGVGSPGFSRKDSAPVLGVHCCRFSGEGSAECVRRIIVVCFFLGLIVFHSVLFGKFLISSSLIPLTPPLSSLSFLGIAWIFISLKTTFDRVDKFDDGILPFFVYF